MKKNGTDGDIRAWRHWRPLHRGRTDPDGAHFRGHDEVGLRSHTGSGTFQAKSRGHSMAACAGAGPSTTSEAHCPEATSRATPSKVSDRHCPAACNSTTLPGPHVLVHEARKGHCPARCPQDTRRTSAGPSCRSSLLPRPSPGPRPPFQFPDFSRRRAPVRLVSSLAVLPVHPVPGPSQWVSTRLDLRPSRDTARAVLRQPSRPLAPRLRLGHLAPSRYLCPRDSSAWHLASTHPSRAPHRQQKHRSGQQTRLSKLAFLSPETV